MLCLCPQASCIQLSIIQAILILAKLLEVYENRLYVHYEVVLEFPETKPIAVGDRVHEMGGACMGEDPKTSVLNKWAQSHDVKNLFVTDGACMSSCATQNPSLTYMAITARAVDYAAKLIFKGRVQKGSYV